MKLDKAITVYTKRANSFGTKLDLQTSEWLKELKAYRNRADNNESCERCYYQLFDDKAYPCSRCICNYPTENMFREK